MHSSTKKISKKQVRQLIEREKELVRAEKRVLEDKKRYWLNQLSEENKQRRDILDVYDDLYDHGRSSIENSLKYLKEYYFFNPQDFNPRDAALTEKAQRYRDRIKKKLEKYQASNDRDRQLARIFKEVKEQERSIQIQLRDKLQNADHNPLLCKDLVINNPNVGKKGFNVRNNNKHLKIVELGGENILVDKTLADAENNRASK